MTHLIRHLLPDEVIRLHDRAEQTFGGLPGFASPGRIEALIARVSNYAAYENVCDLHALAAMYCIAIARGHAFVEGNKRTALNASILFCLRNGVRLHSMTGLDEVVVKAACGDILLAELTEYFRNLPQTVLPKKVAA